MKKILLLAILIISATAFAQNTTKQQDIQTLIMAIQIKATMQNIVDKGIEVYKKQKPAVPQQVWDNIKTKVDYDSYINKVTGVFDTNYSQPEIKNLLASVKPKQLPQFKKIVQQQLYDAGKEFGKKFGNLVKLNIAANGY